MAYIYKIYNDFNDKIYIGKTGRSVEFRFKEHFRGASGSNSYIDASMKKYGIKHFYYEILEECETEYVNERERYWIAYFNSQAPNGYNLTPGGDGWSLSDKQIINIRELWDKGYSHKEISQQLNIPYSTVQHRIAAYDDYDIEESRKRSMKSQYKPITVYSEEGIKIKDYQSISAAAKDLNISDKQIGNGLKGHYLVHGCYFTYLNEPLIIQTNKKRVLQFDLEGNYLQSYEGARATARELSIDSSSIIKTCNGKQITCKGYIFLYEKNFSQEELDLRVEKSKNTKRYRKKEYQEKK